MKRLPSRRDLRLASGVILFIYVGAHLVNLNFAFGKRAGYLRFRLLLFGTALLLPAFAVLGFLSMLKEVSLLAQAPAWVATTIVQLDATPHLALGNVRDGLLALYFAAIAAVFMARAVRTFAEERRGSLVSIGYPDRSVRVPRGWSVLEASRSHRIAHVSMCGGRARCSTCRVRVVAGQDQCAPPADDERRTLLRVHAAPDTRLACQLRPFGNIEVVPLLTAAPRAPASDAAEHEVAVMLVDFRWQHAQPRLLPHDLLYALNRFSETVGGVTRAAGGLHRGVAAGLEGCAARPASHRLARHRIDRRRARRHRPARPSECGGRSSDRCSASVIFGAAARDVV
jgi:adenylate cyclase